MPHPTDKVELTLPTGRVVTWPAPTYGEGRRMLHLLADIAAESPTAMPELMALIEGIVGGPEALEDLVVIEIIEVANRFSLARRHRPEATAPVPTGPSAPPPSS